MHPRGHSGISLLGSLAHAELLHSEISFRKLLAEIDGFFASRLEKQTRQLKDVILRGNVALPESRRFFSWRQEVRHAESIPSNRDLRGKVLPIAIRDAGGRR